MTIVVTGIIFLNLLKVYLYPPINTTWTKDVKGGKQIIWKKGYLEKVVTALSRYLSCW